MPSCVETFSDLSIAPEDLQLAVAARHAEFICEAERCSVFSPGPVELTETVAFFLINPLHYDDERQTVVPDAFQELFNRDLSVIRREHAGQDEVSRSRDELVARGAEKIPPKLRLIEEVCLAKVADIRAPMQGAGRVLAAYDTALESVPSHASIFTVPAALASRQLRKQVRAHVHFVMTQERVKFADFLAALPTGSPA